MNYVTFTCKKIFFYFAISWLEESPHTHAIPPITQWQRNRNCTVEKLYAIIFLKLLINKI